MQFDKKNIKRIIRENKEYFDALARYDETREWPLGRERIYITLDKRILEKLKRLREKTGKPISRIIEEAIKI